MGRLGFRVYTKQNTNIVLQCTVGFRSLKVQRQPVLRVEPGSKFLSPLLSRRRFFKKCHILLVFSDLQRKHSCKEQRSEISSQNRPTKLIIFLKIRKWNASSDMQGWFWKRNVNLRHNLRGKKDVNIPQGLVYELRFHLSYSVVQVMMKFWILRL